MVSNNTWKVSLLGAILVIGVSRAATPESTAEPKTVKLFARETSISVLGKTTKVMALTQASGEEGYSPEQVKGFHVEVVNQLPVPTSIHWHGLILPNLMDGVPFVTQDPIPPGGSHRYDFPLVQSGSYWMHSHYGLQEQQLLAAPMVIRSPTQSKVADVEFTVMLSDFSFTSPQDILKGLMGKHQATKGKTQKKNMSDQKPMSMSQQKQSLVVQQWDEASKRLVPREVQAALPDVDVKYDALLANQRTIDDPQVFEVKPGQSVLLRMMGAASATNFFIDTGALDAAIIATDGEDVQPLKGNFFQLSTAQRLDLLVTIPEVFTVLKYENVETKYWKPERTPSELENPLELNNATALWKEMTAGLLVSGEPVISP